MEKGLDSYIKEKFHIEDVDIRSYSPLVLAYIGDAIYDLIIRSMIVARGNQSPSKMHRTTSGYVKAEAQSNMMGVLLDQLTEEEKVIYKRGRNAKSPTMAKNATMADYRRATGFEALMGYLYLSDQFDRLMDLVYIAVTTFENEKEI